MRNVLDWLIAATEGWKTQVFSLLLLILGVITTLDPYMLSIVLGPQSYGYAIIGIAVATFILRKLTKTEAKPILRRNRVDDEE